MKNLGCLLFYLMPFALFGQPFEKINGVSFVASREEVALEHVTEVPTAGGADDLGPTHPQ